MRKFITLTLILIFIGLNSFGQDEDANVDAPRGLRIVKNGHDYLIYADNNLTPNFNDYRKLNSQVYFRKVIFPIKEENGKKYQLITIPGPNKNKGQDEMEKRKDGTTIYPRTGKTVDKEDYDKFFWIEEEVIEKYTSIEHYKYANDVFSGLLTAPFKYRFKLGNSPEAIIDGDFNVAPFIGWKWRVSSQRPFYVSPFGFAGITTLNYNSANNKLIIESDRLDNGAGLTYGIGISFKFGKISPGIVIGWDKGFGDVGTGFLYNDKAWISFSVNYDFFKEVLSTKIDKQ